MKYVVAGGAGFIGSHIVDRLIDLKYDVIVLDNFSTGTRSNVNPLAKIIEIDLASEDVDKISNVLADADAVFHCAALPNVQFSFDKPKESNIANVDTTINLLESMRLAQIKKIVYSSSSAVYGDAKIIPTTESSSIQPLSPYALQKYLGELYCHLYARTANIQHIIFRYFNVYGERMSDKGAYVSVLSHFLRSVKEGNRLNIVNTGEQKRDFVYVKDVAEANVLAGTTTISGNHTMNLGYGKNYSVNTIADCFNRPKKYGESRVEPFESLSDISLAKDILGWLPTQKLFDWIQQQISLLES
jgi:UDP-glucose 4-epimerase